MTNYIQQYIKSIESGDIKVCRRIKQLYLGVIKPIIEGNDDKYYFDIKKGSKFIEFAEKYCKQSKGEWNGRPLKLLLFQKAKYQCIFGILRREDDRRRFREVLDIRGRKNGKSTEYAALGLYLTLEKKGAEVYAAATVSTQARRIWEESKYMIQQSDAIAELLKYKEYPSPMIYSNERNSYYRVLSKNVKSFDGLNASCAIIDEIHELARQIYDVLQQSMSTRTEPLLSMITTAGFQRAGLFDDKYKYACEVLEGIVPDEKIFPLIYELDSNIEVDDEECWIKANPAIDEIKSREFLRDNVAKMKSEPNFANTVKVKDFNLIGVADKSWLSYDEFNIEDVYTDISRFDNTICLGGFDLSKTSDLTAFTTLLFDKEKHRPIAISMYWITQKFYNDETSRGSLMPWPAWIERGLVRVSGIEAIDYHDVAEYLRENFAKHGWIYQYINYDRWSARYLVKEIASLGYSEKHCLIPTAQGPKTLSIPMQTLASHLISKVLCYQNNQVTKWCLSNVQVEQDRNGNILPVKRTDSAKIDGVATILNCYVSLCDNMDYYLN